MQHLKERTMIRALLEVKEGSAVAVAISKIGHIPIKQAVIIDSADAERVSLALNSCGIGLCVYEVADKDYNRERFIPHQTR